jgi:glycerol-3-phosphate acyltransferase PlsY
MSLFPAALLAVLLGYLLGAINMAILLSRQQGVDIRELGSGNAGFANAARTLGKATAALVVCNDVGKGLLAAFIGEALGGRDVAVLAGAAAVLGHVYPVYFGFRGGKGVATAFGMLLLVDWLVALAALAVFVAGVLLGRYMLTGVLAAAWSLPGLVIWLGADELLMPVTLLGMLITWLHRGNIRRLRAGREPKASLQVHKFEKRYEES